MTTLHQARLGDAVPADARWFADWVRPHLPAMAWLAAYQYLRDRAGFRSCSGCAHAHYSYPIP